MIFFTRTILKFEKLKDMKYIWIRDTTLIEETLESFENFQCFEHTDLTHNNLK